MAKVTIYEHSAYSGKSQELGPGRYSADAISLADNIVSSVDVPPGWKVTLWSDAGFGGTSTVLTGKSDFLANFNDTLSALTVTAPCDEALEESSGSLGFINAGNPTWVNLWTLALDFGAGSRGFTFEAWVWFDAVGNYARIFDFHQTNGSDNLLLARDGTSNNLLFQVRKGGGASNLIAPGVIENGQWMHIAVTLSPTGWGRIYCKGTEVASGQLHMPDNIARANAWLGRSAWPYDAFFAGQLAEVRIWNLVRSEDEIKRTLGGRLTGGEVGLFRYFRLDEKSSCGGMLKDRTGKGAGAVGGTPLYSLSGPKLAAAADAAGGLWFDGVTDHVALPGCPTDLSTGFTLEAWVNFADTRAYSRILELSNGWNVDSVVIARDNATKRVGLTISRPGTPGFLATGDVIQDGTWMHVAATMSDVVNGVGKAKLYINGLEVARNDSVAAPSPGPRSVAYLGKSTAAWDPLFKGCMSEVRIWSRARTIEQIQATMFQRLDPREPGLAAYYPLNERGSTLAHDVSPSGLDGVLQSGIGWKQPLHADYVPLVPPSTALLFNGDDTYVQLPTLNADFSAGLTLEAWVCFDSVTQAGRIFDLGNGPGMANILLARSGVTNDLTFWTFRGSAYSSTDAPGVLTIGRWVHVAATLGTPGSDGTSAATLYVNGVASASKRLYTPDNVVRSQCYVGKSHWSDPLFKGRMAELRIWTHPRTQAEIREAMNRPLTGNEAGLHLYYPLAETSGNVANPRLCAGPSGTPPWPVASTRVFNGSDTFVRLLTPTTEVPTPSLTSDFSAGFTIEAWVYCDTASNWARIVELGNFPFADNLALYRSGTSNSLLLSVFRGAVAETLQAADVLVPGSWRHVAATLDAPGSDGKGTATLYLNGVAKASMRMSLPRNAARTECYIGKSTVPTDSLFKGRMAEVRIWTRARTQAELSEAMSRPLAGNEPGLAVYRSLAERSLATIKGRATRQLAESPPTTAGALGFDGIDDTVQIPAIGDNLSLGFSLSAWAYLDDLEGSSACLVDLGTASGSDRLALSREGSAGDLLLQVVNASGTPSLLRAQGALMPGQWLHIAATLGSVTAGAGQATLYVNGLACATGSVTAPRSVQRDSAWVGRACAGSQGRLRGRLTDLRIFDRPRSPADLKSDMQTPCSGNERGLLRHYPLDDTSGSLVRDLAGETGKLVGAGEFEALPHRFTRSFDGVDTHLPLSDMAGDFSQGFTIEAWVLFQSRDTSTAVLDLGCGLAANNILIASELTRPDLRLYVFRGATLSFLEAKNVIQDNVWMHVAATMDSILADGTGFATLYINGEAKAQGRLQAPLNLPRPSSFLGRCNWPSYRTLRGRLSEVRIWTRCRTQAEIQTLMRRPLAMKLAGLYRHYPLEEPTGWVQERCTGAGVSIPNLPSFGLPFNGKTDYVQLPTMAPEELSSFTLEARVFFSGTESWGRIFDLGNGPGISNIVLARYGTSSTLSLVIFSTAGTGQLDAPNVLGTGSWMHIAATYDRSTGQACLYVNGQQVKVGPMKAPDLVLRQQCYLGKSSYPTDPLFRGGLSEVRIFNVARTAAEILANKDQALGEGVPELKYSYRFCDQPGWKERNAAYPNDAMRTNREATLVGTHAGMPSLRPDAGCLRFDGRSTQVELPGQDADLSQGFTLEAWIAFSGSPGGNEVLCIFGGGTVGTSVMLWRDHSSKWLVLSAGRAPSLASCRFPLPSFVEGWLHLALAVNPQAGSTGVLICVNGNRHTVGGLDVNDLVTIPMEFRSRLGMGLTGDDPFQGRMAEVRLWSSIRSESEIYSTRSLRRDRTSANLLRCFPLNDQWGTVVREAHFRMPATRSGDPQRFPRRLSGAVPTLPSPGGLEFNGTSTHVALPAIRADFSTGFTLEAWVYFDGMQRGARIIELGRSEPGDHISLGRHEDSNALFLQVTRGNQFETLTTPPVIVDRSWMHIAATATDNGQPKIYVNGVLQSVASTTTPSGAWPNFMATAGLVRTKCYLGKSSRDVPLFKGRMADVRLWRRERTEEEIKSCRMGSLHLDDPALVANYRLDEVDGMRAGDASSARLDAEVRGMKALWGAPSPYLLPDPNQPGSLSFSGRDWVELPAMSIDFSSSFTLEAWVLFDTDSSATVLEISNGLHADSISLWREDTTQKLSLLIEQSGLVSSLKASSVTPRGTWTHVAVTGQGSFWNPLQTTIYINGEVSGTANLTLPATTSRRYAYLGKSLSSVPLFRGRMAEVRIWSRALNQRDIQRGMTMRRSGSEAGLFGYYRLNDSDGERAGDASRNRLHGWVRGTASWSQAAPLPDVRPDGNPPGILPMLGVRWVTLPALPAPAPQSVPRGYTLEAWVSCGNLTQSAHFISLSNGTSDALYLGHNQSALVFGVQAGSQPEQRVTIASVFTSDAWVHIAASVDENGQVWVCKDGQVLTPDTYSVAPPSFVARTRAELGRSSAGVVFCGFVSEARIWTTPRTPRHLQETRLVRLGGSIPGLAACYPLQASRGLTGADTSSARLDGVVWGDSAPVWDGFAPPLTGVRPASLSGLGFGALSFDGVSTYLRLPPVGADLSRGFAFEATIRGDGGAPLGAILDVGNGSGGDNIQITAKADGRVLLRIYADATTYTDVLTAPFLLPQTWHVLAISVDSQGQVCCRQANSNLLLTINGVSGSKLPPGRMPRANMKRAQGYVGKSSVNTQQSFKGSMKEVRLWSVGRTESELLTYSGMHLSGTEPGLLGLYWLTDGQGRIARGAAPGLGDATVCGDGVWGVRSGPGISYQQASALLRVLPQTLVSTGPLPVVGLANGATPTLTNATWNASVGIVTNDSIFNTELTAYATGQRQFSFLGTTVTLTMSAQVGWCVLGEQLAFSGTPSLQVGSASPVTLPSTTLTLTKGSSPMPCTLSFVPSTTPSITALARSAATDPLIVATFDAVLKPFLDLVSSGTVLLANTDGSHPQLGSYLKGLNLYVSRKMSELPGLEFVHTALPQLGLDSRSVVLSVGLGSTAGYTVSASAVLNFKLIDTAPVSLIFNELGLQLSQAETKVSTGVVHRVTLKLLGETLVFRGGVNVEQTGGASAATIWGALDPGEARGTTWKDPWGLQGIEIGGFGVQVRGGTAIGIGCRGEIHIGDGLIGGSVGLNLDNANPILLIDSPEGIDLPRMISAFLNLMPQAAKDALSALNTALSIRLKDLKLYLAPNGGEIAGQTFEKGISLGASLDLWGYRAKIFGRLDQSTGAVLKGQADRIKIDAGGVTILQFSDVSGAEGPNIDCELTTARQRIFFSGQLRLLNGVYQGYEELAVGSDGISFKGASPLGALALALNWQAGTFAMTLAPRFTYGFEALGIPVNIDVGGTVAIQVDSAGFKQSLSFAFRVCGVGLDVGPVSWGIPFTDLKAIADVFESFFGDQVKSFFEDTIAGGLKQAYEWVRDNLTSAVEEAIDLFKTAGAMVADIAKNIFSTFDTTAHEVISFLGGTINEAADLLKNALNLAVSEAAEVLGAAYGATESAVKDALAAGGYVANEIASVSSTVWEGLNTFVGYLDPTSW
jgi:hypothetical protein